ncbi:transmembrane protein 74 [Nothobranchius furzeri]|uniref:Transmembrane protein 74 n=1 Tax=Nothobranchius furzeri TaxID=105023 RepID=A0A1A8U2D7_NOTFU|nr:transmembrane protein 74 [Nothobranchius furzeri]KAF7211465.1 transmembrane protein 74-like [Nothobranchius furzeri]
MADVELAARDHRTSSPSRTRTRGVEQTETRFTCRHDEEEQLIRARACQLTPCSSGEDEEGREEEDIPELYLLSEDNLSSGGPGTSVDYGFILAVCCLVTGISLVAITYTVPRDVRVDPDSVSAREMEGLEREKAGVGAHLDRCVIAGLCLLTLGGVLLSTLLMVSMWKSEKMRRTALDLSRRSSKLYGSMSLRSGTSPTQTAGEDGV